MKRFFSFIIALVVLFCTSLHIFTAYHITNYRMPSSHLTLYTNASGASLLSYQGGDCYYKQLTPSESDSDFHIDHTISSAAVFDNTVVALSNDAKNNQMEVYLCYPRTNTLYSFAINGIQCNCEPGFCYNGKSIFLINTRQINSIEQYDLSGGLIKRYTFNSPVTQLGADYKGDVFVVSSKTLYRLASGRFNAVSRNDVTAPISYFSESHFTDSSGGVYQSNSTSCNLLFRTQARFGLATACIINSIVYYPNASEICGYRLSSGEKISSITLSQPISALYARNRYVIAVSDSGSPSITKIHPNEFTDLTAKYNPDNRSEQTPQKNNSPNVPDRTISSSIYRIDFTAYRICRIPLGTTFAQLKSNINHGGYTASLYRNGKEIKSGQCGTGMTLVFDSDSAFYTFELSVIGDLTGEGNVNSRDLSVMMEYLIDQVDLSGVYYLSADLSDDKNVDVKDLAILHRSI